MHFVRNRFTYSDPRGERGQAAVIAMVALSVILVVVGVTFTTFAASNLRNTGSVSDLARARGLAQAGIADAMFRIDNPSTAPANFCAVTGRSVQNCLTVAAYPNPDPGYPQGDPGFAYVAQCGSSSGCAAPYVYTVTSQGKTHGRTYTMKKTVARQSSYQYAYYTRSAMSFTGNWPAGQSPPVATSGTCSSSPAGADGGNPTVIFLPGNISGSNCSNQVQGYGTFDPKPPVNGLSSPSACPAPFNNPTTPCLAQGTTTFELCPAGMTTGTLAVPGGATVTFNPTGPTATLNGPLSTQYAYTCTGPHSLVLNTVYTSPANATCPQLVDPNKNATIAIWDFSTNPEPIQMGTAQINQQCGFGQAGADAGNFQIYVSGPSPPLPVGSYNEKYPGQNAPWANALLWAPNLAIDDSGGHMNWYGAMLLNQFKGNGANLTFDSKLNSSLLTAGTWVNQGSCQVSPPNGTFPSPDYVSPNSC